MHVHLCMSVLHVFVCICYLYLCVVVFLHMWYMFCASVHMYVCDMPNIRIVSLTCMTQNVQNVKMVLFLCPNVSICLCVSVLCVWCAKYKISIFSIDMSKKMQNVKLKKKKIILRILFTGEEFLACG